MLPGCHVPIKSPHEDPDARRNSEPILHLIAGCQAKWQDAGHEKRID
jgi:hypothetical protein